MAGSEIPFQVFPVVARLKKTSHCKSLRKTTLKVVGLGGVGVGWGWGVS